MAMRPARHFLWLGGLAASALAGGLGCDSAAAQRGRLGSANPFDRATAVVTVTRTGDLVAVHKLVDLLDDTDRTVRMYAILGLRRLCGEDFGYRYYAISAERAPAVARWRDALRTGTLAVRDETRAAREQGSDEAQEPAVAGEAP
jgi:hypothetical protein